MADLILRAPNGHPYKPLPAQTKFHESDAKYRAFLGGVGSGKTLTGTMEAIVTACEYPGSVGLIGRWSYRPLKYTTWQMLQTCLPKKLIRRRLESQQDLMVQLWNDSIIYGWNMQNWETITSLNLDWWYIDEVTELPDDDAYRQLMARLRNVSGPHRGWVTGTPNGRDWVWKRFIKGLGTHWSRKHAWFQATTRSNPYNPPEFEKDLREYNSSEWVARFLDAEFNVFEGAIFHNFDEKVHVMEAFEIPPDWPKYRSIDPGMADPTAVLWAAADEEGNIYVYREFYETDRTIADVSRAVVEKSGSEQYVWTVIDPAAEERLQNVIGKTRLDLYRDCGIDNIQPGNRKVAPGIAAVIEHLRVAPQRRHPVTGKEGSPKLFIFPTCPNLIAEMRTYRYGRNGKPVDKDDHAIAALRWLLLRGPYAAQRADRSIRNPVWDLFHAGLERGAKLELDIIGNEQSVYDPSRLWLPTSVGG